MSRRGLNIFCCLAAASILTACQSSRRQAAAAPGTPPARAPLSGSVFAPSHEARERILALDPEHVTEQDINDVLAGAPAPKIINIHGGLLPLQGSMTSFSEFLVGMGYPRA